MKPINALSQTPFVRNWWAVSRHPRILHVFDQACNLINERREVLSIVIPQIGNGPFNLVVEDKILFSEYIKIETPIFILRNQLTLGDLIVNIDGAKLWNPRPDWERLHSNSERIFSELKHCIESWKANNVDASSQREALPLVEQVPSATAEIVLPTMITNPFSNALVSADISIAKSLTPQLAGLGQGLTPAGDDFIVGAILAAWIIHPPQTASALARELTETAAALTTSLSAAWLRSAGRGEAGILWHQFFDALTAGEHSQIQEAMDKILAVGETSGTDALLGFMDTFESCGRSKTYYRSSQ